MKSVFVFFIIFVFGVGTPELLGQSDWIWLSDFSGGLNTVDAPTQLKETEALVLRNAVIDSKRMQKRRAFTQASSKFADDGVRALYRYYNGISKQFQIIAIAGNAGYVSTDDGVTFAMFYTDSGVTVTNGSLAVVAPDSGSFRKYRDLYMSGWKIKLPDGVYTVSSWTISADADPDTLYLEIPYTGSTGQSTIELSPYIGNGYIDFETWLNNLYIADGINPVKVWTGATFRHENAKRFFVPIDSCKIDTLLRTDAPHWEFRGVIDTSVHHPTVTEWENYTYGHYGLLWSDNDAVGVGDNFYYSKPTSMNSGGYPYFYLQTPFDTAFMDQQVEEPDTHYNVTNSSWVYITLPKSVAAYSVVDTGSFEAIIRADSVHISSTSKQFLFDYVDSAKSWTSTQYNYDATYLCFTDPSLPTTRFYNFRCYQRTSAPAVVALRVAMSNFAYIYQGTTSEAVNWYVADYRTLPQKYWIVRLNYGGSDVMPSSRFVRQQANVLWCAGFNDAPSQVWVSEPGVDSAFGAFIFDALGWDGDEVTQLFDIYNYIYTVKSNAIVQIQGNANANFSQNPVVYDFGLKSSQSMFNYRNGFVGYNEEGFFLFNGGQPQPISDKIFPILRDSINQQATAIIDGIDAGRFFVVACPFTSSTVNNRAFTFDLQTGSWQEWTGRKIGALLMNNKVTSGDTLMYGDSDSGVVWIYGREYDDNYDFQYVSPFITGSDPSMEKQTLRYLIEAGWDYGDSVEVSFYANDNLSTAVAKDTLISSTAAHRLTRYIADCDGAVIGSSVAIGLRSMTVDTLTVSRIGLQIVPIREIRQ